MGSTSTDGERIRSARVGARGSEDGPPVSWFKASNLRRVPRLLLPPRDTLKEDALAGLPGAISSVPDGMASAVLVGVNPIHGLYASAIGPLFGGYTSSTRLMTITTTTAAALAAGSALQSVNPADRPSALFLLTIIAGALMIAAGVAKLGRYTRFVSLSVMTGFLTGVAANIFFGQLADLCGTVGHGEINLTRAIDVLLHPGRIDLPSLLAGLGALALVAILARTRIASVGSVVALAIPSILVLGSSTVARVSDSGEIPRGLPLPHLPELSAFSPSVIAGALAVAGIVLVQGAGVAESAPNTDGSLSNPDRDFSAQGIANVASGLFRGQPVGGSVGQTALNVAAGARSRFAAIFSGLWLLVIVVFLSGLVGHVAMPTLAAVLMYAAYSSLRLQSIEMALRTGPTSQIALGTTFLATLLLPVAAAVGIGVALSLLLQLNREAVDLRVVELKPLPDGRFEEHPAPAALTPYGVTLLDVYGSLYYAGARTLAIRLPDPTGATRAVAIVRLRGRTALGATGFAILAGYAERVEAAGGRVYLSGVDPDLVAKFRETRRVDMGGRVHLFEAEDVVGDSSARAYREAETWIARESAKDDA
jgi:SulP family sulfate permease